MRGRRRELEGQEGILRGREAEVRKKGKNEAGKIESLCAGVCGEKENENAREREGYRKTEGNVERKVEIM